MNIFSEEPDRTITMKELQKILIEYDQKNGCYPENYYEGLAIAEFINEKLTGQPLERNSNDWIKDLEDD